MTPTDALMGGLIAVLSGTLVVLWLQDAQRLSLICGAILCCYLLAVVAVTFFTAPRRGQRRDRD